MDLESVTRRVEERLRAHEELLARQKERYEQHRAWVQGEGPDGNMDSNDHVDAPATASASATNQRATPSFSPERGAGAANRDSLPHHDELIFRGALTEFKKEEARSRAVQAESQALREVPEISRHARKMTRSEPIVERMEKLEAERLAKLELERQKQLAERETNEEVFTHKPKLTQYASNMPQGSKVSQKDWEDARVQKLAIQRAQRAAASMSELRGRPEITPRSAELAARRDELDGLEGMPRYEQILERDRIAKWVQEEKRFLSEMEPSPKITMRAAKLKREGDVSNRLFEESYYAMSRRRDELEQRYDREEMECTHTPRITAAAHSLARDGPVEDLLYTREQQRRARQEQRLEESKPLGRPMINPVSEEIVARLPESARERLMKQRVIHGDPNDCSFSPSISTRSRELTKKCPSFDNRAEVYMAREAQRQHRLEQKRLDMQERELEECTFHPTTLNSSGNAGAAIRNNVYNRVDQWQRRKEQKQREAESEREAQFLKECTFQPATSAKPLRSVSAEPPRNTIYGGDGKCWGFHEFVQRQKEARELKSMKEEEADAVWNTGSKWKNKPTVPVDPQLGMRRACNVKSLKTPAEPPSYGAPNPMLMDERVLLSEGTLPESSPLAHTTASTTPGAFSNRLASSILSADTNPVLRRALETLSQGPHAQR
eukprot:PhM_4_TR14622/c0_g1_i1/m.27996